MPRFKTADLRQRIVSFFALLAALLGIKFLMTMYESSKNIKKQAANLVLLEHHLGGNVTPDKFIVGDFIYHPQTRVFSSIERIWPTRLTLANKFSVDINTVEFIARPMNKQIDVILKLNSEDQAKAPSVLWEGLWHALDPEDAYKIKNKQKQSDVNNLYVYSGVVGKGRLVKQK